MADRDGDSSQRTGESSDGEGAGGGRLVWVDALKTISIFAVILLHCAAPLLLTFEGERGTGGSSWWIGNLYDSAVRWSVPVFVMVSGALLLGRTRDESVGEFLRRRLLRVALPFLAWSVLYFEWQIFFWDADQGHAELLPMLLREPISYHLWFVYMLLGIYLLAPLLGTLFAVGRPTLVYYGVGLWLLWAGVLPAVERLAGTETWYSPGRDNSPLMLVGYFLLGFLLRDLDLGRWRGRVRVAMPGVYLLAVAATAWLTYVLTRAADGDYQPLFYEYYSLNVVVMAVAVYLAVATIPVLGAGAEGTRRARTWRFLSERVFGVYLVHVMVLDVFKRGSLGFRLDHASFHPGLAVLLLAVAVFLVSLGLVLVLERIPLLGRVLA